MNETLTIIAYQRDQLCERDSYIRALELALMALGGALIVTATALIYLI